MKKFSEFLMMSFLIWGRDNYVKIFSYHIIFGSFQKFTERAGNILDGLNKSILIEFS